MVLTEQQKKELVERLRVGREQKAAEKAAPKAAPKKAEKAAPKKAEKAEPPAAPKPAPVQNTPVIPFKEELPPPVITDKPPKKAAPKAPLKKGLTPKLESPEPCIFEDVEEEQEEHGGVRGERQFPPPSRKEKRLNKQKYMAIKFYEKPDERLYKKIMKSVQPDSSDEEPAHEGLRILDYEKEKKERITEAEKAEIERRKMEAVVRLMG